MEDGINFGGELAGKRAIASGRAIVDVVADLASPPGPCPYYTKRNRTPLIPVFWLMTNTAATANKLPSLLLFLSLVALVAAFGAQFEPGAWYSQLQKPDWNPPNWVFGPVWTLLYIGIAVAGWLVWRATRRVQPALQLWGMQLIANGLWSWLFFGLHQPGIALVDISLLFCLIVSFIIASRRYSVAASWLFVPYAIWVGFAAALNASIWSAN